MSIFSFFLYSTGVKYFLFWLTGGTPAFDIIEFLLILGSIKLLKLVFLFWIAPSLYAKLYFVLRSVVFLPIESVLCLW